MKRFRILTVAFGLAVGAPALGAQATPDLRPRTPAAVIDSAALDARTREVAAELRCPVCQGESIQESPSELAQEMKSVVRDQLAAGRSPEEVKQYFVARYGEWILLRPTTTGFNAMLYVLPPILLIAGAVLVFLLARRWVRANTMPPATPDHVD